ncbi:MAG: metallophosphoesterase [Pyrinomonadaceae bacterium]
MHELTGNQQAVLEVLRQTIFHLGKDSSPAKKIGMDRLGITNDSQWTMKRDTTLDMLERAYRREQDEYERKSHTRVGGKPVRATSFSGVAAPSESAAKDWYMPRDRTIAVFQAAMDEYIDQKLESSPQAKKTKEEKTSPKNIRGRLSISASTPIPDKVKPDINLFFKARRSPTHGAAFAGFEKYDNLDPRWISVVWEKAKSLLRGKAKFIKHKKKTDFRFKIVDKPSVTIALVSDWGGGNNASRAVAAQIKACQPDHVIHLGDVYYAGTEHEINNRFLNLWDFWSEPATPGRSFALNANHEMYGGGHGYFKTTLKALKQPASYFSLSNNYWRFIGLDTGYVDHDLNAEQLEWLGEQLQGSAKTFLLSHHQPFSAFTDGDPGAKLRTRVQPFFDKISGWFWGHEHLCIAYGKHLGINGRCIGHGCIPYEIPTPSNDTPVTWIDKRKQPNGRGMHGFALLTLNDANMKVEYIDQNGAIAYTESF